MTSSREARIRALLAELADVLVEGLDERPPVERLLTVNEAADRLKLGRTALYQAISSGRIRSVQIGRTRRIPESAIADLVEAGR